MTTYPHEAGEAEPFVPPSLAHLDNPPTFHLRWGTPREKERYRRVMDEEGAVQHSDEAMRAELTRAMKALFTPDEVSVWEGRAREFWSAVDAWGEENSKLPAAERIDFELEGKDLTIEVLEQLARDWRPYRLMQADNNAHTRIFGPAINSVIVERYENVDVEPVKRGRHLTFDCIVAVAEHIDAIARRESLSTLPSHELSLTCLRRMFLDKERE